LAEPERILILHAKAGAGHKRAAEALEQAFRSVGPSNRVHALDTLSFASPLFQRTYAQTYDAMVKRAPPLWRLLYWSTERPPVHRGTSRARVSLDRLNLRRLVHAIRRFRPAAVVCTHFLPLEALAPLAANGRLGAPLYCVITDFGAHPFWVYDGITGYFVATEAVREELAEWGVSWESIHVTGIPIDPKFGTRQPKEAARAALGLDPKSPVALVMGGGNGVGPLHGLAERLLGIPSKPQIVVIAGRNEALRRRLGDLDHMAPGRVKVLGFTNEVDRWLDAADVNVTKAGGLTCSESLAKQVPLVIFRPTPGQEERNSEALTTAGAALRARTIEQVAESVERVLSHPSLARTMRRACEELGRPEAAAMIATEVLEEVHGNAPREISPAMQRARNL
jgi:processive 1,2-diacylglycerol beta-glucosyltransferase